MKEDTKQPPNGCKEENRMGINAKFNLRVIRPKVDALKTKASAFNKHSSNRIRDLLDFFHHEKSYPLKPHYCATQCLIQLMYDHLSTR
jgi:hypothetical protein